MKHATLTILLLTFIATLAFGAGNNWRNERPITGLSGTAYVMKSAIATAATDGYKSAVVYTRNTGPSGSPVRVATSNNGGVSWTSEIDPGSYANAIYSGNGSRRTVGIALSGNVIHVVWVGLGGPTGTYYGVHYTSSTDFGVTWSGYQLIATSNDPGNDSWPSVAISLCGNNVEVAWSYYDWIPPVFPYRVAVYERTKTTTWQTTITLADYNSNTYLPTPAVDIAGRTSDDIPGLNRSYVVWDSPSTSYIVYARSTNYGVSWPTSGTVDALKNNSHYPAVKVKYSLTGHVLWERPNEIRSKTIGGNPSAVVDNGNVYAPRFAIDSSDSLYAVYDRYNNQTSKYYVHCQKSPDGYTWYDEGDIQHDPNTANSNRRSPDAAATYTDGIMREFVWNGVVQSLGHQELWLGVNDLGNPAAPTNLQAVKFCSMPPAFVQVTYTATTALDDSGYNNYKHEPKCGPPWTKLNSDIVTGTVYYDFTIPQSYPECDAYCACYMARAIDLALNEGGDSNTSQVGFCDAPSLPPATLLVAASLGQPAPSAYTQRRGGYLNWGSGKSADVDPDQLEYRIRGLDTSAYYVLDFQYYAPESGRAVAARAGGTLLHGPKAITQEEICIPNLLPKASYASGTLSFAIEKVEGPNAILGKFRLWKMPDGFQGGPQSAGLASRSGVQPYLAPPRPNPSTGEVFLGYWLPKAGEATLRVYNTAGQLVREVDSGQKNAGTHSLTWDGKNASGHKVPNGIYLVRLVSGNVAATQKVTILR